MLLMFVAIKMGLYSKWEMIPNEQILWKLLSGGAIAWKEKGYLTKSNNMNLLCPFDRFPKNIQ